MKTPAIVFFFVSLLLFGCSSPDLDDPKTIDSIIAVADDAGRMHKRDENGEMLLYMPGAQTPYTGWAKSLYKNGQIKHLFYSKEGKLDGLETRWYENGQTNGEVNWKNGKKHRFIHVWYETGQKHFEGNYNNGRLVDAIAWKLNGEKCPITNFVDGNGVLVHYKSDDGTLIERLNYKDGKLIWK